jgi:hypothetical protein
MHPPPYVGGYEQHHNSIQIKNNVPDRLDEFQHDSSIRTGRVKYDVVAL